MPNSTESTGEIVTCADCGGETRSSVHLRAYGSICQACCDAYYARCPNCSTLFRNEEELHCGDYCSRICLEEHNEQYDEERSSSLPWRSVITNLTATRKYRGGGAGAIITSARKFGVEIEAIEPDSAEDAEQGARLIPQEIGISDDGSIRGNGVEFQTPILAEKKGEQTIRDLCRILNEHAFRVNNSCGLHVHLDGAGFTKENEYPYVRALWLFYLVFEDVLLSFLPHSRRRNRFCTPLKRNYHLQELLQIYNQKDLEALWYRTEHAEEIAHRKRDKWDGTRYNGFNFHCLFWQGHLEIRFHSGTLNAEKILHWVALQQSIMDIYRTESNISNLHESVREAYNLLTLTAKTEALFSLVKVDEQTREYFLARQRKFTPTIVEEYAIAEYPATIAELSALTT